MTKNVNKLSFLYETKYHTKIGLMHKSNFGPRFYNRIIKRNSFSLQNYNFYKIKTEL